MIVASQIELIRGGRKLLDNASATIHPGHKVGLVGKNGCGKSTFLHWYGASWPSTAAPSACPLAGRLPAWRRRPRR